MEVKKIEWGPSCAPVKNVSHYDHCIGKTPAGEFILEWKSWKLQPSYSIECGINGFRRFIDCAESLGEAKEKAQSYFDALIKSCVLTNGVE